MFLKADVIYDANITTATDIAQAIDDLGFPSMVLEDSANHNEKAHLLVKFPIYAHTAIKKVTHLKVGGMTCSSCVRRIESHVLALKGVESCTVSLHTSVATIDYSSALVGLRDIIDRIQVIV
jgi:Cu+-exporting ATPase